MNNSAFSVGWRDLRQSGRSLLRNYGYSSVALLTLAIGVGFSTAIFSFVDAVLLKPLPYENADRIVRLAELRPNGTESWTSTLDFFDWNEGNTVFEMMAVSQQGLTTLTGPGDPVPLRVGRVSARYFDVFGVRPFLGRTFTDIDDSPGNEHVVVLSHVLWANRFGSDRTVVGKPILLDGVPYTVVGVLPQDSAFDRGAAQIWYPLALHASNADREYRWLSGVFGLLKSGSSLDRARAELSTIVSRIAADYPDSHRGWGIKLEFYADSIVGPQLRRSLLVLLGAVGGLLLICCCNLASLSLARAISRRSESAVRASLGAGRLRLIQLYLSENLLLAVIGGGLGILAAFGAVRWLGRLAPTSSLPSEANVHLDARVLVFALVVSLAAAAIFGLVPAIRAGTANLSNALRSGRRSTAGGARRRLFNALVVGEVALAFILLCFSALFIRSFVELTNVDTGFESDNVLTMNLPIPGFPPGSNYSSPDEFNAYLGQLQTAVSTTTGVRDSALTTALPLTDCCLYQFIMQIEGRPVVDRASRSTGLFKIVTPSYFTTLGLRLKSGRFLNEQDTSAGRPVIVVNERLANRYFPDEDPIGRRILSPAIVPGKTQRGPDVPWEIVGVIADEKISALNDESTDVAYASYEQSPAYFANLVVRANLSPQYLESAVRSAVYNVNKTQGIMNVRTLDQIKSASSVANRFQTVLLGVFAAVAIVLAATGIYGVLAYMVAQRSHEMAIRSALGGSALKILILVLKHGLSLAVAGLAIGLAGALLLTPLVSTLLFEVEVRDPYLLGGAAAILLAVAAFACFVPAWRAARASPMTVLRAE
jgi:putative ABC transport system permease protein